MLRAGWNPLMINPVLAANRPAGPFGSLLRGALRSVELSGLALRASSEFLSKQHDRLPTPEEAREGLRFADQYSDPERRRAVDEFVVELFGRQSVVHNLRGQAQLFTSILGVAREYVRLLSEDASSTEPNQLARTTLALKKAYAEYRESLTATRPQDIDPRFVPLARRHYLNCLIKWAQVHGLNVEAAGREHIPEPDAPTIYLPYSHSSLLADFLLSLYDNQLLFGAAADNYFDDPVARKTGFSLLSSRYGQPLFNRRNPRDRIHLTRMMDAVEKFGLRPGIFPQMGRVLMAYDSQGRQERAGFYSAIIVDRNKDPESGGEKDVIDIESYARSGGLRFVAGQILHKLKRPVHVVPVVIKGAEMAMPATTGDAPFIGPDRFGGTVAIEFLPPFVVDKGNKKAIEALALQIEQKVRQASGIDEFLEERVRDWALQYNRDVDLIVRHYRDFSLDAEARGDPDWSVVPRIADLIRTIHPEFREPGYFSRGELISAFLMFLESGDRERLKKFRQEVVETAYQAKFFAPEKAGRKKVATL